MKLLKTNNISATIWRVSYNYSGATYPIQLYRNALENVWYNMPLSDCCEWPCIIRLTDTSATRHFGIKTLWDTSAPISRHFDTKNVVRDTSTRVPWSRKSRDTSTQDNSDETQLHRWFGLNCGSSGTDFMVPKCLGAEVSGSLLFYDYVTLFIYR